MKFLASKHYGKEGTGEMMISLVESFFSDLGPLLGESLQDFFALVASIPYKNDFELLPSTDENQSELISRPKYLLDNSIFEKLDCKKKAILMASWAEGNGTPWRFIAVQEIGFPSYHHVFTQMKLGEGWFNVDPTFPGFKLFEPKPLVMRAVIL